ncbi:DUF4981 domain-containing protein, partial [candidate division KSB1 bacterium]|nr:DUF4981 domain-containing protein [candidate division KSB1 bacterium]
GYGYTIYRNIPQAFYPFNPPYVPDDINPVGCYQKKFTIASDWQGRQIFLHFEGVKSASFVWVNDQYVGYDQGGMTPSEYDITPFVRVGENTVSVEVIRWCDGSYLEDQDMWRFSGIYRDVYLFAAPDVHIRDFFVRTDLDDQYKDADLLVDVHLKNYSDQRGTFRVLVSLYDADNTLVTQWQDKSNVDAKGETTIALKHKISDPLKWSAEKPNLYKLTLTLLDSKNNKVEVLNEMIGFRKVEIKDGLACVNGVPIEFRGVNKHQHHPEFGRTMTTDMIRKDMGVMKQFNVNAVRLSHYPNNREWYEFTDEYGIYVQDEVNVEAHHAEFNIDGKYGENWFAEEPSWEGAHLDRFVRMLERDKNNPSIVMWSTGNEAGTGPHHYKMAEYARRVDGTRLIMHQCNHPSGDAPYADISGPRYPSPERLRALAEEPGKPIVMGEYAHAMGNSLGHFHMFWDYIHEYERLQGGFIWDWADQGLTKPLITTPDRSAHQHLCALMGLPKLVPGKFGQALELSGFDDWIEVYNDPCFDTPDKELTLSCWIYPRGWFDANPFITKGDRQYVLEQFRQDSLRFAIFSDRRIVEVTARTPNDWDYNWHQVAGIYDGKELLLIVDGKILGRRSYSGKIARAHYAVNIGKNAERNHSNFSGRYSNALIDRIAIFNRALDPEQLYALAAPIPDATLLWLELDELKDTGQTFYYYGSDNFCINGVVFPDRTPQPELWQMKKSHAPVVIKPVDLATGKLKFINYHHFTNLSELKADWCVTRDGEILDSGLLSLDVPPLQEKVVQVPLQLQEYEGKGEIFLTVSIKLPADTRWAPKGHEITFEQFKLPIPVNKEEKIDLSSYPNLTVTESESAITIDGDEFEYVFDKQSGIIRSIKYRQQEMVKQGLKLSVYRPPIPNETVNWGRAEAEEWWAHGLDNLTTSVKSVKLESGSAQQVCIYTFIVYSGSRRDTGFESHMWYKVLNSGDILIRHKVIPIGELGWFQKVGLQMQLPGEYDNLSWFGRGPQETYPDRKTGVKMGIHSGTISEQYVPYVVPQDHGNKTDVRWTTLTNDQGIGLAVFACPEMNISASNFALDNLDRARYPFQLQEAGYIKFNIDHQVTGVGGTPVAVRMKYRTYPIVYDYSIRLKPNDFNVKSAIELSKQQVK